jgi:F0F1-type ATP synthase assembly protein I
MLFRPKKNDGTDAKEKSLWGDLISLGLVFPIAIVLGYFIGQWVGGRFGHPDAGRIIGLAWGILAAFWELFKVTKKLEKYDKSMNYDRTADGGEESCQSDSDKPDGGR